MLSTIEHVGVVVDNVAEAKAFLGDVLGLEFHREVDLPHRGVKAAFLQERQYPDRGHRVHRPRDALAPAGP